jgi:hypothetical protein
VLISLIVESFGAIGGYFEESGCGDYVVILFGPYPHFF